jgi:hypothetical protein
MLNNLWKNRPLLKFYELKYFQMTQIRYTLLYFYEKFTFEWVYEAVNMRYSWKQKIKTSSISDKSSRSCELSL